MKVVVHKEYAQSISAEEVTDKRDVVDLRDATDFDDMKDLRFFNEREYYHGWSEGEDIVLLRRDPETGRRIKEVHPFEWYFYLAREDFDRLPADKVAWLCRHHAKRVEPDPAFPDRYVRVYVPYKYPKIDHDRIFQRVGDPDAGAMWLAPYVLGERPHAVRFPQDRERWTHLHEALEWCQRKGLTPLEADLTPKQRFLTDYDLHIQARYHLGFVDIETDDTVGGFDNKEHNRILSIAWEGDRVEKDPDDRGFVILEAETDEAEREMLLRFKRECLARYDVVAAWNGFGFDFPIIIYRFRKHRIPIDWRYHLFADPLPVFKRHYVRAGADAISYSLDAIGSAVLKMSKLDWRTEFRRRQPGVVPKFINLYRREPGLLEEYNRYDATILRKLEAFTGFVAIEQIFCRVANGFANDWNISTKIDQLLLKKGFKDGHHFPTRFWSPGRPEQYEGAYVFPPKVGMHENVCAFDFKSLYPSMVRAFNISPESIVKAVDREDFLRKYGPDSLCRCPVVDCGGVMKGGATFRKDREGYISQMFVRTLERRRKYTTLQSERLKEVGSTQDDLFLLYYRLAYSFKRLGLSFYGDLGNPRSRYYDTELAEAITLAGRFFIQQTAKYAEEVGGYKAIYGDSVTGRRNLVLLDPAGRLRVLPVERLWAELSGEAEARSDGKEVKRADGWRSMSALEGGGSTWAPVAEVIRHRTGKRILRLTTPEGQVEVTEDHGVTVLRDGALAERTAAEVHRDGEELVRVDVPPVAEVAEVDLLAEVGSYRREYAREVSQARHVRRAEVRLGSERASDGMDFLLLTFEGEIGFEPTERVRFRRRFRVGTPELDALLDLLGTFCAEGSVSVVGDRFGGASIGMEDRARMAELSAVYQLLCPTAGSDGLTDDGRKLQMRCELISLLFARLCGVGADGKRVPGFVYHLPERERRRFLSAYLRGDGHFWNDRRGGATWEDFDGWECGSNSLELSSGLAVLCRQLGVPYGVRTGVSALSGNVWYGLRTKKLRGRSHCFLRRHGRATPRLEEVPGDGFVYDLCVPGSQRFTEALGCVSLHNTDSLYIQLAPTGRTWSSEEARIAELNGKAEKFLEYVQTRYDAHLRSFGCRMDWNVVLLEYEDVYDRIFFVVKKRYAGRLLVHKGERTDNVEVKGLEVMRSDCSGMTRRLQQRVLDGILMERMSGEEIERTIIAPEFTRCAENQLTAAEVSIGKGISKEPERYKTKALHVKLAEEIRATGREFFVGMKVEYVVTSVKPNLNGVLREDFEDAAGAITYAAEYYWDRVIYPASLRILQVCFPEKDWKRWLVENRRRRRDLVQRYQRWFLDPKRVGKAVERIRENVRGLLQEEDLVELRRSPRIRTIAGRGSEHETREEVDLSGDA